MPGSVAFAAGDPAGGLVVLLSRCATASTVADDPLEAVRRGGDLPLLIGDTTDGGQSLRRRPA